MIGRRKFSRVLRAVEASHATPGSVVASLPGAWRGVLAQCLRVAPEFTPRAWVFALAELGPGTLGARPDALVVHLAAVAVQSFTARPSRRALRRADAVVAAAALRRRAGGAGHAFSPRR